MTLQRSKQSENGVFRMEGKVDNVLHLETIKKNYEPTPGLQNSEIKALNLRIHKTEEGTGIRNEIHRDFIQ